MEQEAKHQIITLRTKGYSYQEIAQLLGLKKSTVSSFCHKHHIEPLVAKNIIHPYRLCPKCHKLFILSSQHEKQFCSNKCRTDYWRTENRAKASLAAEDEHYRTLQKELDFLAKKSDELTDGKKLVLYRRIETALITKEDS